MFSCPEEDALKVLSWYLYRSVSGMGVKKRGVFWGHVGFPIGDMEEMVILGVVDNIFYPRVEILKVFVDIFIRSAWRREHFKEVEGGQEGGYFPDIEGSWSKTWRTGSSLMLSIRFVYPKKDTLKILCWYLYLNCVMNGGSRRGRITRTLRDPEQSHGGKGHGWCFFNLGKIPHKFCVDIFIRSV